MKSEGTNNSKTILIVDDDAQIRDVLALILADDYRFKVDSASSAEEAIAKYAKAKPDLILTDILMPGISGFELLRNIRERDQLTPIIIVTAIQTVEAETEAAKSGADEFITKPFDLHQIESSVERLIWMSPSDLEVNRLKNLVSKLMQENKDLKDRLEEQSNKIITSINSKQDRTFYNSLAHDIKNEFAAFGGVLHALRHEMPDSEIIKEVSETIERSLHHLRYLVGRMTDHTELGKPNLDSIDIQDLIKRTEMLIQPRVPSNIKFKITANSSNLAGKVLIDAEQMLGGLLEITNNALHALRNSEGIIKLNFSVKNDELIIAVSNNGPVIPEDIRKKLFKEQVRSSKESGTGMGLFLLSQVLKTFGGELSLQGSSPAWTTFSIRLPIYKPQKDQ